MVKVVGALCTQVFLEKYTRDESENSMNEWSVHVLARP